MWHSHARGRLGMQATAFSVETATRQLPTVCVAHTVGWDTSYCLFLNGVPTSRAFDNPENIKYSVSVFILGEIFA